MKLMPIPDQNFEDLLRDYGADVPEDGFSDVVFAKIEAQSTRQTKIKRISLMAAMGIGAVIAGLQFQDLLAVIKGISVGESLSFSLAIPIGAVLVMSLSVWLMEQRDLSL